MKAQVKFEFRKALLTYEFWIAFLLSSLFVNASFVYEAFTKAKLDTFYSFSPIESYIGNKFNWGWELYAAMWPFLIILPFATSFIKEKNNHSLGLSLIHSSYRKMVYAKIIVAFLSPIVVIGIPMFVNLLQCFFIFPKTHNLSFATYQLYDYDLVLSGKTHMFEQGGIGYPLLSLYLYSPFLYACFLLLLLLLFSGICSSFVLSLSFIFIKRRFQLFIPIYAISFLSLKARDYLFAKVMAELNSYPIQTITNFPVHTTKYYDFYLMDYFCILGTDTYMPGYIISVMSILLGMTILCTEIAISKHWELIQ